MRGRTRCRVCDRPSVGKTVELRRAASASPALPAVQHLTELAGGDRRSLAGDRDLVGIGRCVGTQPIRLAVLTPAARLGPPFAGHVVAGEIAGRKCNPEQQNQYDDSDHSKLRLTPPMTFCQPRAGGQGLTCSTAWQCPERSFGKLRRAGRICRFRVRCCSAFAARYLAEDASLPLATVIGPD